MQLCLFTDNPDQPYGSYKETNMTDKRPIVDPFNFDSDPANHEDVSPMESEDAMPFSVKVQNVDGDYVDPDNPYPSSGGVGKLILESDGRTIVWPAKLRGDRVASFNPVDIDETPSNAGEWIVNEQGIIQNHNTPWEGYPIPTVGPSRAYEPTYKVKKNQ